MRNTHTSGGNHQSNLGHTLKKSALIAGMVLPMVASAGEVFEREEVREGSPQAEFIRQSIQESTGRILSQTGTSIEISLDDGKTWIEYAPHAGIAITSLVLAGMLLIRRRRQNLLGEDDDFLDSMGDDDMPGYVEPIETLTENSRNSEEKVSIGDVPQTDYLTELSIYREYGFSEEAIFPIFRNGLNNPGQKNNPTLFKSLVELSFLLGKKDEFSNYYSRMLELVGSEGKNIDKYETMAKKMREDSPDITISEL